MTRPSNRHIIVKTALIGLVLVVAAVVVPPFVEWVAADPPRIAALVIGVGALIALVVVEAVQ